MQYSNVTALKAPIIVDVVNLNKLLLKASTQTPNGNVKHIHHKNEYANPDNAPSEEEEASTYELKLTHNIRRPYFETILKSGSTLFTFAMRQLRGGKDYQKRSLELLFEIQSQCYLVHVLGGISLKMCAEIDELCDKIIGQVYAIDKGQNY